MPIHCPLSIAPEKISAYAATTQLEYHIEIWCQPCTQKF